MNAGIVVEKNWCSL